MSTDFLLPTLDEKDFVSTTRFSDDMSSDPEFLLGVTISSKPGCCVQDSSVVRYSYKGRALVECYKEGQKVVPVANLSPDAVEDDAIATVLGQKVNLEELSRLYDCIAQVWCDALLDKSSRMA